MSGSSWSHPALTEERQAGAAALALGGRVQGQDALQCFRKPVSTSFLRGQSEVGRDTEAQTALGAGEQGDRCGTESEQQRGGEHKPTCYGHEAKQKTHT